LRTTRGNSGLQKPIEERLQYRGSHELENKEADSFLTAIPDCVVIPGSTNRTNLGKDKKGIGKKNLPSCLFLKKPSKSISINEVLKKNELDIKRGKGLRNLTEGERGSISYLNLFLYFWGERVVGKNITTG